MMGLLFLLVVQYKDGVPDDLELFELSIAIAPKWERVGILLGLSFYEIGDIKINEKDKAYRMLLDWKNNTTSLSHYQDLYIALCDNEVQLNSIAKTFCLKWISENLVRSKKIYTVTCIVEIFCEYNFDDLLLQLYLLQLYWMIKENEAADTLMIFVEIVMVMINFVIVLCNNNFILQSINLFSDAGCKSGSNEADVEGRASVLCWFLSHVVPHPRDFNL